QVVGCNDDLIQNDLAFIQFPTKAVVCAAYIIQALAGVPGLVLFFLGAVQDVVAAYLVTLAVGGGADTQVADKVAGARRGFLRPGHAGFQTSNAAFQLELVVVENPGGRRLYAAAAITSLRIAGAAHVV